MRLHTQGWYAGPQLPTYMLYLHWRTQCPRGAPSPWHSPLDIWPRSLAEPVDIGGKLVQPDNTWTRLRRPLYLKKCPEPVVSPLEINEAYTPRVGHAGLQLLCTQAERLQPPGDNLRRCTSPLAGTVYADPRDFPALLCPWICAICSG